MPETQESERSGEAERMPGDGWAAVSVGKELNFGGQILSPHQASGKGPLYTESPVIKKTLMTFF